MSPFTAPASEYMSAPVRSVRSGSPALDAERLLDDGAISALAVVTAEGRLIGVISQTDLLETAWAQPGETLRVAETGVDELMGLDPIAVPEDTPLTRVAKVMLRERIHRVFVTHEGELVGVISARELMRAVADAELSTPALEIATRGVVRVRPEDTLALAVDRLDRSNKHGLIVVREGVPVGTFSQSDALRARAHDPRTPVADVMNPDVLSVAASTPLCELARRAVETRARRAVLLDDGIVGVVSPFDFARAVR